MLISDLNILSSGPQISIPVPLSLDHPQLQRVTQLVGKVYKLTRVIKRDEVHIKVPAFSRFSTCTARAANIF